MSKETYRLCVVLLLLSIALSLMSDGAKAIFFGIVFLFCVGCFVCYHWDGDKNVDDWLDPGSTDRGVRRTRR